MKPDFVKSQLNGAYYDVNDAIRIINPLQAATYIMHGAIPLEIYVSKDFTKNKPVIVYLFSKTETKELYSKWCKHELKWDNLGED